MIAMELNVFLDVGWERIWISDQNGYRIGEHIGESFVLLPSCPAPSSLPCPATQSRPLAAENEKQKWKSSAMGMETFKKAL